MEVFELSNTASHFERVICALLMWPPFFSRSSLHMAYYRTPWYFNCKSITHIHTYIQAQPDPISTRHHNITCLMLRRSPIIKPTSTGWLTSAFPVVRPSTKTTCLVMYATKVVSNSGVCLQYIYKITELLHLTQPKCKWGRILLILMDSGQDSSAIPWANLLKVQHGDGDNSIM